MIAHRYFGEGELRSIPRSGATATATAVPVQGFMACPPSLMGRFGALACHLATLELYRLAYEQAKACVAPPWHLKSLLASPN